MRGSRVLFQVRGAGDNPDFEYLPTMTTDTTFANLALAEPIQRALIEKNYPTPSPIQAQAIPHLLAGKDLIGCAQTGTGKTAAFALPILHLLSTHARPTTSQRPRALILTPTRELAAQIAQNFDAYGKHLNLSYLVLFGGVGQTPQVQKLKRGVDILVATPGRLLDLHAQRHIAFDKVEIFVLDEADRMLDMGFVHDVKKVMALLPARRQSLLFSATMPPAIQQLADRLLHDPVRVEVSPVASTAERIQQHLCYVERNDKRMLLAHFLEKHPEGLVLVFVKMKHGADRLVQQLAKIGVRAEAIHGNKSQNARERALENFRAGRTRVLIATDIAARGIDVKGISLVINFDIPNEPESYVHRIGRTARAGAEGLALAFCDPSERGFINSIERLIKQTIPVIKEHPYAKPSANGEPVSPKVTVRQDGSPHWQSRKPKSAAPGNRPQGPQRHQRSRNHSRRSRPANG
jgi:ATP-dependent RNA helicase RhlE